MKKRTLGKTNEQLSVIGFGGIIVMNESQENSNNFVAEAVDKGVNYFDIAPTYGNAQERNMGILALKSLAKRQWQDGEDHIWNKCWYKPIDDASEMGTALRFTFSKPVTAAIPPGHIELFRMACEQIEKLGDSIDEELTEINFIPGSAPIL